MEKQANWREPIFSFEFEIVINKDKMEMVELESFFYLENLVADLEPQA